MASVGTWYHNGDCSSECEKYLKSSPQPELVNRPSLVFRVITQHIHFIMASGHGLRKGKSSRLCLTQPMDIHLELWKTMDGVYRMLSDGTMHLFIYASLYLFIHVLIFYIFRWRDQAKIVDVQVNTSHVIQRADMVECKLICFEFLLRMVVVCVSMSLCACAGGNRRHKNKNRSTTTPRTADRDIDDDVTTYLPDNKSSVDSKWKHNAYKMWTIDKYPDPHKQPRKCGRPRQPSFLCDPDRILSATQGK